MSSRAALLAVSFCAIFAAAVSQADGNAAGAGRQVRQAAPSGEGYGAMLDRASRKKEKGYLESLRRMNAGLRNEHAALVKGRTAYSILYRRTQQDLEYRRATPYYVLKKMQDLEAEGEKLEAGIKEREEEKRALEREVLASWRGVMPQRLAEKWKSEEEEYAAYVDGLYRQVGWWMQVELSGQWRNDESRLWDYLRQYYQDHPRDLDILK